MRSQANLNSMLHQELVFKHYPFITRDNVRLQAMLQAAKKLLGFGPLASIGPGFHQDAVGDNNRLQMLLNAEQQRQVS